MHIQSGLASLPETSQPTLPNRQPRASDPALPATNSRHSSDDTFVPTVPACSSGYVVLRTR